MWFSRSYSKTADEDFSKKHEPFCAELKLFLNDHRKSSRTAGPLNDEQRATLRNYALAAVELFRAHHPYLGRSKEIHALSYRYVKHYGSSLGLEHVDLLMYLRLGIVFCLKTNEPYVAKFRAHDSSDKFEITVREGDVYTLNEARANDCSHQIATTNLQGDAKISLVVGYFQNSLTPLQYAEQKNKWSDRLDWTNKNGGIRPIVPMVRSTPDIIDTDLAEGAACDPAAFSDDELAFAMRALTGQDRVPTTFDDICGLQPPSSITVNPTPLPCTHACLRFSQVARVVAEGMPAS